MNIYVRFSIILLLLTTINGSNRLSLYSSIQSNLSKYRQTISPNDFSFQNGIIRIILNGRRTNIQSQLLLGFYSVGMALNRADVYCREIEIVINYEMKAGSQTSARAPVAKVLELSQGRLSSEQFFILIGY